MEHDDFVKMAMSDLVRPEKEVEQKPDGIVEMAIGQ